MSIDILENDLYGIQKFFLQSNIQCFGFFKKNKIPKSLIKIIRCMENNNIKARTLLSLLNCLIVELYGVLNKKSISAIEKANINKFIAIMQEHKKNLILERREFLKKSGIIAAGLVGAGILRTSRALASEKNSFGFLKSKIIVSGKYYFENLRHIINEIIRINVFFINNGELDFFYIDKDNISRLIENSLIVNGYITHIEVFSKIKLDELIFKTENQETRFYFFKIGESENLQIKDAIVIPGYAELNMNRRKDEDFLKSISNKNVFCYGAGSFTNQILQPQMIPIAYGRTFMIILRYKNQYYNISFYHDETKITQKESIALNHLDYGDLYFAYNGSSVDKLYACTDVYMKMYNIVVGVYNVQRFFRINLVKYCVILDYQKENANAGSGVMITYLPIIKKYAQGIIRQIAEHETLHEFGAVTKLDVNKNFIKVFDAIKQEKSKILSFIVEEKFFGKGGGHPEKDPREFFASFVHTLLYASMIIDKYNQLKDINERKDIIDNYRKVLNTVIDISEGRTKDIFVRALGYIESKINA